MAYKPFLIKKDVAYGDYGIDTAVHSSDEWNVYVTSLPFRPFPDMKDLPSNDWKDEDGDDEYLPDRPAMQSYEMEVSFAYIGTAADAPAKISSFLQYLAFGGYFSIYSQYTGIGRKKVRYVSYDDDALSMDDSGREVVTFKVTLKVNDPVTNIALEK